MIEAHYFIVFYSLFLKLSMNKRIISGIIFFYYFVLFYLFCIRPIIIVSYSL